MGASSSQFADNVLNPACLVCQDGINCPRLIFPDGATRVATIQSGKNTDDQLVISGISPSAIIVLATLLHCCS
jgi:hypothetical protein